MTFEEYFNQNGSAIIRHNLPLKVGDIIDWIHDAETQKYTVQKFKIKRIAKEVEYLEQDSSLISDSWYKYFYEVTTD